jgi:hypothetical protein
MESSDAGCTSPPYNEGSASTMPTAKDESERLRVNRDVGHTLTRHSVDISKLNYACSNNHVVTFHGRLHKAPSGEFDLPAVRVICAELKTIRGVRDLNFFLENWEISPCGGHIRKLERWSGHSRH